MKTTAHSCQMITTHEPPVTISKGRRVDRCAMSLRAPYGWASSFFAPEDPPADNKSPVGFVTRAGKRDGRVRFTSCTYWARNGSGIVFSAAGQSITLQLGFDPSSVACVADIEGSKGRLRSGRTPAGDHLRRVGAGATTTAYECELYVVSSFGGEDVHRRRTTCTVTVVVDHFPIQRCWSDADTCARIAHACALLAWSLARVSLSSLDWCSGDGVVWGSGGRLVLRDPDGVVAGLPVRAVVEEVGPTGCSQSALAYYAMEHRMRALGGPHCEAAYKTLFLADALLSECPDGKVFRDRFMRALYGKSYEQIIQSTDEREVLSVMRSAASSPALLSVFDRAPGGTIFYAYDGTYVYAGARCFPVPDSARPVSTQRVAAGAALRRGSSVYVVMGNDQLVAFNMDAREPRPPPSLTPMSWCRCAVAHRGGLALLGLLYATFLSGRAPRFLDRHAFVYVAAVDRVDYVYDEPTVDIAKPDPLLDELPTRVRRAVTGCRTPLGRAYYVSAFFGLWGGKRLTPAGADLCIVPEGWS